MSYDLTVSMAGTGHKLESLRGHLGEKSLAGGHNFGCSVPRAISPSVVTLAYRQLQAVRTDACPKSLGKVTRT